MPLLDMQRRGQQIGRLRIGQQVAASKGGTRPAKLETFRFTTQSKMAAQAVAELYGGTVQAWNGEWEVITRESAIGVTVPPRDEVVSQWYEMWTKGGCQRRCDSVTDRISGGPCLCPRPADNTPEAAEKASLERSRLASLNPPQACKRVTRISVMIPDLPTLGVWRLDTGSYYAASEIGDTAQLLQMARDQDIFLPAMLRIEQRSRVAEGKTKHYPVPVLEITATFRQIASGQLEAAGITAQLPPPPGEQPKALTAGTSDPPAPAQQPAPVTADGGDERQGGGPVLDGDTALTLAEDLESWEKARELYQHALAAASRPAIHALAEQAKALGLDEEVVCVDKTNDVWEPLLPLLQELWKAATA